MMKRMLAVMAIAMAMLVALAWAARSHQAPSGWAYPYECCAGHDCAAGRRLNLFLLLHQR
jgi:hypothetical protein